MNSWSTWKKGSALFEVIEGELAEGAVEGDLEERRESPPCRSACSRSRRSSPAPPACIHPWYCWKVELGRNSSPPAKTGVPAGAIRDSSSSTRHGRHALTSLSAPTGRRRVRRVDRDEFMLRFLNLPASHPWRGGLLPLPRVQISGANPLDGATGKASLPPRRLSGRRIPGRSPTGTRNGGRRKPYRTRSRNDGKSRDRRRRRGKMGP